MRHRLYRLRVGGDASGAALGSAVSDPENTTANALRNDVVDDDAARAGRQPVSRPSTSRPMGARSTNATLTENRGGTAATGTHLYVGIDVGRRFHLVTAVPRSRMEDGSWERAATKRISTDTQGFHELLAWLSETDLPPEDVRIGCEPTGGGYALPVAAWLERHGYRVQWLQNWAVHDRRHLLIGKQAKTDALDARLIARLVYERDCLGMVGGFITNAPKETYALRMLVRNRSKLSDLQRRYRLQLGAIEDMLFPELKQLFRTSTTGPTTRVLVEHFPTPAALAAASADEVHHVLAHEAHASRVVSRIPTMQELARSSVGLTEDIDALLHAQRWLLHQLKSVDQELKEVGSAVTEALAVWPAETRAVLSSLPCLGPWRQAVLLSVAGDLARFRSDRQLRKFLGWYPEARESGTTLSQHRLGLSGNRLARREVWLWAMSVVSPLTPTSPFRDYYQRLRARGMPGHVAIGHLAGKLISVLFFCARSGQLYDPERHSRDLGSDDLCHNAEGRAPLGLM